MSVASVAAPLAAKKSVCVVRVYNHRLGRRKWPCLCQTGPRSRLQAWRPQAHAAAAGPAVSSRYVTPPPPPPLVVCRVADTHVPFDESPGADPAPLVKVTGEKKHQYRWIFKKHHHHQRQKNKTKQNQGAIHSWKLQTVPGTPQYKGSQVQSSQCTLIILHRAQVAVLGSRP